MSLEICRKRKQPNVFRKLSVFCWGRGVFYWLSYLGTLKKDPGITGGASGVGALVGMLCSPRHWSYRNSYYRGMILAFDTETLVWP